MCKDNYEDSVIKYIEANKNKISQKVGITNLINNLTNLALSFEMDHSFNGDQVAKILVTKHVTDLLAKHKYDVNPEFSFDD